MNNKLFISWSARAKLDIRLLYLHLLNSNSIETSRKIRDEIIAAPKTIIFPEQFQHDDYMTDYRRIIVRNYKILYYHKDTTIFIISVFNSHRNPSIMKA
jgi:plasmid stabilization system protein ParE